MFVFVFVVCGWMVINIRKNKDAVPELLNYGWYVYVLGGGVGSLRIFPHPHPPTTHLGVQIARAQGGDGVAGPQVDGPDLVVERVGHVQEVLAGVEG